MEITEKDIGSWYLTRNQKHVMIFRKDSSGDNFLTAHPAGPDWVDYVWVSKSGHTWRGEETATGPHPYDLISKLDALETELLGLNDNIELIEKEYNIRFNAFK